METAVATLLLVTAAVVLASVVIGYGITAIQQTMNTQDNPQLSQLKSLESSLMNQTADLSNATLPQASGDPSP